MDDQTIEWMPPEAYKATARVEVKEPPCRRCANWQPARQFDSRGEFLGVRYCQAEEMAVDFSCFCQPQNTLSTTVSP